MVGKTVTVFGATGTAGGGVMRQLLAAGWTVKAVTRDASGSKARAIAGSGAQIVEANLDDRASIRAAIAHSDAVYLSGPSLLNRWDIGQAVHGINVADAVREVGNDHLIYQSALVGDAHGVLSVGSKRAIEERIAELQLRTTILRPGWFMDNFLNYFPITEEDGKLVIAMAMPVGKENGLICADDIGRAAVAVMADAKAFTGSEIEVVSDVQSFGGMAAIIGEEMGKPAVPVEVPIAAIEEHWPEGTDLYRWLSTRPTQDSADELHALIGETTSFRQWVRTVLVPRLQG